MYTGIYLPSEDDPSLRSGPHIPLRISSKLPMSVNNDLEEFYQNDKPYLCHYCAVYCFLLTKLSSSEQIKYFNSDPRLLQTLKFKPKITISTELENTYNRQSYLYHLCLRKTVIFELPHEKLSSSLRTYQ